MYYQKKQLIIIRLAKYASAICKAMPRTCNFLFTPFLIYSKKQGLKFYILFKIWHLHYFEIAYDSEHVKSVPFIHNVIMTLPI